MTIPLLVDAVIAVTLLEAVALLLHRWRTGRGLPPVEWVPNLASGLCLMLALHGAVNGRPWPWIALPLAAAGVAHAADLTRRWRAADRSRARR